MYQMKVVNKVFQKHHKTSPMTISYILLTYKLGKIKALMVVSPVSSWVQCSAAPLMGCT